MAKDLEYGLTIWLKDRVSRVADRIVRKLRGIGRAANRLTFGRRGLLGSLVPGGLMGGGLFGGVLGAARSAVSGVVGVVKGGVKAAVSVVKTGVRLVSGLVKGVLGTLRKVTLVGGAAFAGVTAFAVRQAARVEDAWSKVRTILDLGPLAARVKAELRELAVATGRSLTETIEGFYQVLSAGFTRPAEALQFLRATLKGAVAGWADFPTVVKAASRVMRNFRIGVSGARDVMDKLLKTVDVGQIELPELAAVIGGVAKSASGAHASLEEMLASLGVMAQTGPPQIVATQLRGFFLRLQQVDPQGLLREGGLAGWLRSIRGMDTGALREMFPGRRAFLGVRTLLTMLPQIERAIVEVGNSAGKTEENLRKRLDNLLAQWRRVWTRMKALATSYGQPIVQALKEAIEPWPALMAEWQDEAEAAGQAVAGLVDRVREFFSGRIWRWEDIRGGLADLVAVARDYATDLLGLFARGGESGIEMGPLTEALVAAFEWAAARIEGIFRQLWITVGRELRNRLGGALADTMRGFGDALVGRMQEQAQQWWSEGHPFLKPEGAGFGAPWEGLDRRGRESVIDMWGEMHPVQGQLYQQALGLRNLLMGAGMAMQRPELTPEEQRQERWNAWLQAREKEAAAAERLSNALDRVSEQIAAPAGAAGAALQGMAPLRPGPAQPDLAQALGEQVWQGSPALRNLAGAIQEKERTARSLRESGFVDAAANVRREAEALRRGMGVLLRDVVADQKVTHEEIRELNRQISDLRMSVRRLATAR